MFFESRPVNITNMKILKALASMKRHYDDLYISRRVLGVSKKWIWKRFLPALVLVCISPSQASDPLTAIETCMRANIPPSLQIREFEISSTSKAGSSREFKGRLYARLEGSRISATMAVTAPADMRGSSYLVREAADENGEDEMYVYLPALRKTKRIVGAMRSKPLFGTDISYSDIRQIGFAFTDDSLRFEREEVLDGRPVWVLSMAPDDSANSRFDSVTAWIDQESCMALKADFSSAGEVRKRFSSSAEHLAQSGPHWYLKDAKIEDLQDGTQTRIQISEVLSDKDLANRLFNPRGFYLGN